MTNTNGTQRSSIDDQAPLAAQGGLALVNQSLDAWSKQLGLLGGAGFKFDRFKAIVLSCFSRTPKLMECTRYSLRQAVQAAAELGLELGGVNGEAYLIPYKNKRQINGKWLEVTEAQFMAGYKGYLRLAQESGLFRRIFAHPILSVDEFDPPVRGPAGVTWAHRERPFTEPEPMEIEALRWEQGRSTAYMAIVPRLKGSYAVAQMLDSRDDDIVKVIPAWRLEQIRQRSKAGRDGPWITDYPEMAAKTALRALWKQLPKSDRMLRLEEHDAELDVPELRDADVASMFAGQAAEPPKRLSIGEKVRAKATRGKPAPESTPADVSRTAPTETPPAEPAPEPEAKPHEAEDADRGDNPDEY